jgi:hypothetical protein
MRALQFTDFGPVSNLRLIELPDPRADSATAIVKVAAGAISPRYAIQCWIAMPPPKARTRSMFRSVIVSA